MSDVAGGHRTLSVRLPAELYALLVARAAADDRSLGWLVRRALAEYLSTVERVADH